MSTAAAIGERKQVGGFALVGVEVHAAGTSGSAWEALDALGPEVGLLILSASAHRELEAALAERPELIWTVIQE